MDALWGMGYQAARGLVAVIRLEGSTIAGDLGYRVAAARVVAIGIGRGVLTEPELELERLRTNLPGVTIFDRLYEMLDAFPGLGGYSKCWTRRRFTRSTKRLGNALAAKTRTAVSPLLRIAGYLVVILVSQYFVSTFTSTQAHALDENRWSFISTCYAIARGVEEIGRRIPEPSNFLLLLVAVMVWLCMVTCTSTLSRKKITGTRISRPLQRLSLLGIAAAMAFPQPPGSQVVFIICLIYTTTTLVFGRTVFLDAAGRYFVVRPNVYAKPAGSPTATFRPSAIRNTVPRRLGGEQNDG